MLEKITSADFDEIFRLMEISFPPDERRTREEQQALLSKPYYNIFGLKRAGKVTAFAAVWRFETFAYIDHLATVPEARGGGLGAQILHELLPAFSGRICLEVEPPETELAARRIGFYTRNGFFLNQYPYTQPPITAGRNPIPLLIMTAGRAVDETEFREIKDTLYTRVYGV